MALAIGATALLALLAGLLAVPIELYVRASSEDTPPARLHVEWLFGWLRTELRPSGSGPPAGRPGWLRDLVAIWNAELQEQVVALFRELRRRILLRELRVRGRIGLGDPADTGRAWAVIAPLASAAHALPNVDVRLEPDFFEAGVHGETRGRVRLVPIQLLRPLVAFGGSRPTRRAVRELRSRNREARGSRK